MNLQDIYSQLFDKFGQQNWWPADTKEETIIGTILTQNTSWKNAEKAIANLKEHNLIDFTKLEFVDQKRLAKLIYSAGYFNQKAKRLVRIAKFFRKENLTKFAQYSLSLGRNKLLQIKGIGPETADSILLYAFQKKVFVIDSYTIRVFSRLGLFPRCISYIKAQNFFMKQLPMDETLFNEFHALIVKFAKTYCKKRPDCKNCILNINCNNRLN